MDINQEISQIEIRPTPGYISPAHNVYIHTGPFRMGPRVIGAAIIPNNTLRIDFPNPYKNGLGNRRVKNTHGTGQYAIGAAPTQGIYNGVKEDFCS